MTGHLITVGSDEKMKCTKCAYNWMPRKDSPKECPRCKTRLDYRHLLATTIGGA